MDMSMSEKSIITKSLIIIGGGVVGILLGILLKKDREMTEKYLTSHDIPH